MFDRETETHIVVTWMLRDNGIGVGSRGSCYPSLWRRAQTKEAGKGQKKGDVSSDEVHSFDLEIPE
jgi:hypothetical protein